MSPRNQSIAEGKTAKLICKATGFPKPAITWTFNDRSLPSLAIETHINEGNTWKYKIHGRYIQVYSKEQSERSELNLISSYFT